MALTDKLANVNLPLNEHQISAYREHLSMCDETIAWCMENYTLSREQIDMCLKMFFLLDRDGDGSLSVQDLSSWFKATGPDYLFALFTAETMVELKINELDTDGKGLIDFLDYLAAVQRSKNELELVPVEENWLIRLTYLVTFQHFDKDGDGYLGVEDLRQVMADLGKSIEDEDCQRIIQAGDVDGDGRLGIKDFVSWATAIHAKLS